MAEKKIRNNLTLKQKVAIAKMAEAAASAGKKMTRSELLIRGSEAIGREVSESQVGRIVRELDLPVKATARAARLSSGGNTFAGHHHRQAVLARILAKVVEHTGTPITADEIADLSALRARRRVSGEDEARSEPLEGEGI